MKPTEVSSINIEPTNDGSIRRRSQALSPVLIGSCLIPIALIVASAAQPSLTPALLHRAGDYFMANFPHWIVWCLSLFLIKCALVALIPSVGRRKLGVATDKPEFSYFSWFSMIFGAGMGVGMFTWGVAEPLSGMQNNPDVIRGLTQSQTFANTYSALKWSYLHWGLGAWACYAVVGLAIAYTGHRQRLPLTIRTSLIPLFGNSVKGNFGNLVDIAAVAATLLCILQTLGFAIDEFVICLARTTDASWLLQADGSATIAGKLGASAFIMSLAAASAMSGLNRGIRWLSNINMSLSLIVLGGMLIAGSFWDNIFILMISVLDYLVHLPMMMFQVWDADGTQMGDQLQDWQGTWSMFHWSWWLAFAPFVGVFLAKISKGRTVREYVFVTIVLPAFLCMVWMAWAGGSAITLELSGAANGDIVRAATGEKIFAMVAYLFDPWLGWAVSMALVLLLTTHLTTSIDSAIVVTTTLLRQELYSSTNRPAVLTWATILFCVMAFLILSDGFISLRSAMVAAAVPISILITLLCVSLGIAFYKDTDTEYNDVDEFQYHLQTSR